MIIERLDNPRTLSLNKLDIWVFMSERVVKEVGQYIGCFVESDPKKITGVWRDYLKVRITVNIEKPLKRRIKLIKNGSNWFWVNFKYERVPIFCFICGIVGHSEKYCEKLFDEPERIEKPYGLFMCAQERRQFKQIGARWLRNGGYEMGLGSHSTTAAKMVNQEDQARTMEFNECK